MGEIDRDKDINELYGARAEDFYLELRCELLPNAYRCVTFIMKFRLHTRSDIFANKCDLHV